MDGTVLRVQDRISTDSGIWCVACHLVVPTHRLTPHPPHFLSDFPDEPHIWSHICVGPPVSVTRTGWGGHNG